MGVSARMIPLRIAVGLFTMRRDVGSGLGWPRRRFMVVRRVTAATTDEEGR